MGEILDSLCLYLLLSSDELQLFVTVQGTTTTKLIIWSHHAFFSPLSELYECRYPAVAITYYDMLHQEMRGLDLKFFAEYDEEATSLTQHKHTLGKIDLQEQTGVPPI